VGAASEFEPRGCGAVTYHPRGGSTLSTWFHDAPWLDFNGAQIGWKGATLLKTLDADYARTPPKPVVNIEPWYELWPVRKKKIHAFI
jgi:hypothetical protein